VASRASQQLGLELRRGYNCGMTRSFRPSKRHRPGTSKPNVDDVVQAARAAALARQQAYRARSLEIHGWICAKCAREFDESNLHLLTVHHRDGNHDNNPPDGSNWENLCVYCHEDEHSRGILADYLAGKD
jgi:5-methylcytosine-specific restriction endonuclease McrA